MAGSTVWREEAQYLHRWFFRRDLPADVLERYIAANGICLPDLQAEEFRPKLARMMAHDLDVEAIEFALRLGGTGLVLTRKIHILFYLLEVRSQYYDFFVEQKPGRMRSVGRVVAALTRSGWMLLKGRYLVWRHRLA